MSDVVLSIGGAEASLADIANLNMDDIAEVRFEAFPRGGYAFKGLTGKIETVGSGDDKKAVIAFESECFEVYGEPDGVSAESVIGKKHREVFFLSGDSAVDNLGRAKAYMSDTGFTGKGTLQEMLDAWAGTMFKATVKHRKDKNDEDRIYANQTKFHTYEADETVDQAAPAAA